MMKRIGNRSTNQVNNTLQQLLKRMEQLEESIKKQPVEIRIEHVYVDRPALDQLTFQLEGIDIEELSGSLNLGNNFGVDNGSAVRAVRTDRSAIHQTKRRTRDQAHDDDDPKPSDVRSSSRSRKNGQAQFNANKFQSMPPMVQNEQERSDGLFQIIKTHSGYSVRYPDEI